MWDGIFHSATCLFVLAGLFILWRTAHRSHLYWSNKLLWGTLLTGFGIFNVVEGIVDHQLLGVHHVNETVSPDQFLAWDIGFLVWGTVMLVIGLLLWRSGKKEFDTLERTAGAADARFAR